MIREKREQLMRDVVEIRAKIASNPNRRPISYEDIKEITVRAFKSTGRDIDLDYQDSKEFKKIERKLLLQHKQIANFAKQNEQVA